MREVTRDKPSPVGSEPCRRKLRNLSVRTEKMATSELEAAPPQRGMYQHPDLRLPTLHNSGEDISSLTTICFFSNVFSLEKPKMTWAVTHLKSHSNISVNTESHQEEQLAEKSLKLIKPED